MIRADDMDVCACVESIGREKRQNISKTEKRKKNINCALSELIINIENNVLFLI